MESTESEIQQLAQFLSEFNKESDRGAALVAASMIEERLEQILGSFFAGIPASKDLLSGFNAPLGTFSASICRNGSWAIARERIQRDHAHPKDQKRIWTRLANHIV